jgi:hypothetical protein
MSVVFPGITDPYTKVTAPLTRARARVWPGASVNQTLHELKSGTPRARVDTRCVLLLFYFWPSAGGPSKHTEVVAKKLVFPMKNAIGF